MLKCFRFALLSLVCISIFPAVCFGRDITVQWQPSTSQGVTGYNFYYGASSGNYTTPVALNIVTTYTLTHQPPGTYYIAVTALNSNDSPPNNESSPKNANEIVVVVPSNCDINGDGVINVLDYQALVNVIKGVSACPFGSCDVNRNGTINVQDLQYTVNAILGTQVCPY